MNQVQYTDEYWTRKIGKTSASNIAQVMSKSRNGVDESTGRRNYKFKLVLERLTGKRIDGFSNKYMEDGLINEEFARKQYEFIRAVDVEQVGFVDHPIIPMCGCSPDGLIGTEGMIEIKCKIPTLHFEIMESNKPPTEYIPQMQFQLEVTGRKYVDFLSYNPDFPEKLKLIIVRYEFNEKLSKDLREAVVKFNGEIDILMEKIKSRIA